MAREKALDKKVMGFVEAEGGWCIKYWAGSNFTKKGVPDILACINGDFYGIEDKSDTGRPSMLQLKNLEWIRAAGGYGILLYPKDFKVFTEFTKDPNAHMDWYTDNIRLQEKWKKRLNSD